MAVNDASTDVDKKSEIESNSWVIQWITRNSEGPILKSNLRVLYLEDEEADVILLRKVLLSHATGSYNLTVAHTLSDAMSKLEDGGFDVCLADLSLPDAEGVEVIEEIREKYPKTALVVVSGNRNEQAALNALKTGAHDYLIKGRFDADDLEKTIRYAIERCSMTTELMEQRIRAEEASLAKSQFLSNMSHEIRTPLNSIIGISSLLQETTLDVQQTQYVELLIKSGRHLLELINNTLDLSRIEAGEMDVASEEVELVRLIENMADIASSNCRKKGLDFCVTFEPRKFVTIKSDERKIRQILFNLIGNAIKFTLEGHIHLKVEVKSEDGTRGFVRFSVSDTGIGVDHDKRDEIFRDFSQGDATITRKYGGSGLGLSLCKRFAKLLGGTLSVESEKGKGSTFVLEIPTEMQMGQPIFDRVSDELKISSITIVDDNEVEAKILAEHLTEMGVKKINQFTDPTRFLSSLDLVRKSELFFIDCRMPSMGGFETLDAALKVSDIRDRVVMMLPTGHRSSDLQRLKELDLRYYFVKPIKPMQLKRLFNDFASDVNQLEKQATVQTTVNVDIPKLRILVVEDVEENRFLIKAYFKNTIHQIEFAPDGLIGFKKCKEKEYDLVLMDLQMPEMDGFTATEKIREYERSKDKSPVPIIALTAHAFKNELKQALVVGCNDYLSKPVSKVALMSKIQDVVQKVGGQKMNVQKKGQSIPKPIDLPTVDYEFLKQYDELDEPGETKVVDEMIKLFRKSAFKRVKDIEKAVAENDPQTLRHEAHAFKSGSGNLGAMRLRALCEELERLGKEGKTKEAAPLSISLESELNEVFKALERRSNLKQAA